MKKPIIIAITSILSLAFVITASARKCDALQIHLTAKPGYVCSPVSWALPSGQDIKPATQMEITSYDTKIYTVSKHLTPVIGKMLSGKVDAKTTMTFACDQLWSTGEINPYTKKITIRAEQAKRSKLRAGAISGDIFPTDARSPTTSHGVCAGKDQKAGSISWVLG